MPPTPAFRPTGQDGRLAVVQACGFGMLSVTGPEGPLAAQVPFVLEISDCRAPGR